MRPPGYVRPPLPFDSLDHLVAAAAIGPEPWRGREVVAVKFGATAEANAPSGEQGAGDRPSHLHREHYPHLVTAAK